MAKAGVLGPARPPSPARGGRCAMTKLTRNAVRVGAVLAGLGPAALWAPARTTRPPAPARLGGRHHAGGPVIQRGRDAPQVSAPCQGARAPPSGRGRARLGASPPGAVGPAVHRRRPGRLGAWTSGNVRAADRREGIVAEEGRRVRLTSGRRRWGAGGAGPGGVVGDNAHAVGWPVFDQQGGLGFMGCDGGQGRGRGWQLQASDQRCPSRPQPYKLIGKVSTMAPSVAARAKDQSGTVCCT